MPSNTTYDPQNVKDFSRGALAFDAKSASTVVAPGVRGLADLTLTDDVLLVGGRLLTESACFGDTVTLQVLSPGADIPMPDGSTLPANTVVGQYVTEWVCGGVHSMLEVSVPYGAKILAGFTLRLAYTNNGAATIRVAVNYDLHKIAF